MRRHIERGFVLPVVGMMFALLLAAAGAYYFFVFQKSDTKNPVACTLEAKVCPDGSAVGRIPPSCEFAACPGTTTNTNQSLKTENRAQEVEGKVDIAGDLLAGKLEASPLLDFTKADYEHALTSDKLIILYFYANWCPICKVEFPNMQAAFNSVKTADAIGFRVNYNDSQTDADEKALAREFGVAYQHTKVLIKNGKRILKAPESWDSATYLAIIAQYK